MALKAPNALFGRQVPDSVRGRPECKVHNVWIIIYEPQNITPLSVYCEAAYTIQSIAASQPYRQLNVFHSASDGKLRSW